MAANILGADVRVHPWPKRRAAFRDALNAKSIGDLCALVKKHGWHHSYEAIEFDMLPEQDASELLDNLIAACLQIERLEAVIAEQGAELDALHGQFAVESNPGADDIPF